MDKYPFIFSNERKYRLRRHVVFWLFWWISQGFLYSFVSANSAVEYRLRLPSSIVESFIYLIPHMFLSYSLMYFVIPRFLLRQKYWLTTLSSIGLFVVTAFIAGIMSMTLIQSARSWIMGPAYASVKHHVTLNIFLSLMAGLRGGLSVAGIAAAIKLMKYWMLKEQNVLQLQKENLASQLQLLKAQVHPHFLFNTLNNIYSHTQKIAPRASALVMGLSDLLRYILHEGSKPYVALSSELKMIDDYIELEQVRYGERLEINKDLSGNPANLAIAPLLLLPFIENCFKHGVSELLEQAWIRFSVTIDGNVLKATFINAKLPEEGLEKPVSSGIGISNARKRLELLYPGRHELVIIAERDAYIVNLRIELDTVPGVNREKETIKQLTHA
jgi:sensor histidine kinase YesM